MIAQELTRGYVQTRVFMDTTVVIELSRAGRSERELAERTRPRLWLVRRGRTIVAVALMKQASSESSRGRSAEPSGFRHSCSAPWSSPSKWLV